MGRLRPVDALGIHDDSCLFRRDRLARYLGKYRTRHQRVYGYPIERAAQVAVSAVREALPALPGIHEVIFCCFSDNDLAVYEIVLAQGGGGSKTPTGA